MLEPKLFISILAYTIPTYISNGCALIFGGGTPLDFNKKFFGKPIFGKGKTIRGTFAGIFFGIIAVVLMSFFMPSWFVSNYIIFGIFLVLGAVFGDIAASFFKRRLGLESGAPLLFVDQLDFVIGSIVATCFIRVPTIVEITLIICITFIMHKITNYIAYKTKLKKVAW
ncbi:MAG: CDP-2,3-bis-(O-geranylgeranyl)-sn-glycerol synthase [Candidatus Diapherotrites archaeon]